MNDQSIQIILNQKSVDPGRCEICHRQTFEFAFSNGIKFFLCPQHQNRESFIHLIQTRHKKHDDNNTTH